MPPCVIVLHGEFEEQQRLAPLLGRAYPDFPVISPSAGTDWREVFVELSRADAEILFFVHTSVAEQALPGLRQLMRRLGPAPALTIPADALHALAGGVHPPAQKGMPHWRPAPYLPSWFALLPISLLQNNWASLDFALLAAGHELSIKQTPPYVAGRDPLDVDLAAWAAQLNPAAISRDFEKWRALGLPEDHVPRQLRFSTASTALPSVSTANHNTPIFSLLCPAYKSAFFEEMLLSILRQQYPHWELLVLIDGPPAPERDRIIDILQRHPDPRVHWDLQENAGTAETRRRLAERATGDFVMFIDDDDVLPENALATLAQAAHDSPAARVLRGGAQLFGLVERYLPPRPRHTVDGISADLFEVNQPFAIERALLQEIGGFSGDPEFGGVGEDTDLFLRIDKSGAETILIDLPLYRRRISTLNQSLLFGGREFGAHIRALVARHLPEGYVLEEVTLREEAQDVKMVARYTHTASGATVYAPTSFINFHTLGGMTGNVVQFVNGRWETECTATGEAQLKEFPFTDPPGSARLTLATHEANAIAAASNQPDLCAVVSSFDALADDRLVLCGFDSPANARFLPLREQSLQDARLNKVTRYRRGEFRSFCAGCPFCPLAFR